MSLIIIFKDEFAADRRCVLRFPYAYGQMYHQKKLHIAANQTFAFAGTGPTLSTQEKYVLEAILVETFKNAGSETELIELAHQDWFNTRLDLSFLVMTKRFAYHSYIAESEYAKSKVYSGRVNDLKTHHLIRVDPERPIGHGTGMQVAAMALMEGVPMKELMPVVASVIFTVSSEFDMVKRSSLKRMST